MGVNSEIPMGRVLASTIKRTDSSSIGFLGKRAARHVASILHLSVGAVYTHKNPILATVRETLEKSRAL